MEEGFLDCDAPAMVYQLNGDTTDANTAGFLVPVQNLCVLQIHLPGQCD